MMMTTMEFQNVGMSKIMLVDGRLNGGGFTGAMIKCEWNEFKTWNFTNIILYSSSTPFPFPSPVNVMNVSWFQKIFSWLTFSTFFSLLKVTDLEIYEKVVGGKYFSLKIPLKYIWSFAIVIVNKFQSWLQHTKPRSTRHRRQIPKRHKNFPHEVIQFSIWLHSTRHQRGEYVTIFGKMRNSKSIQSMIWFFSSSNFHRTQNATQNIQKRIVISHTRCSFYLFDITNKSSRNFYYFVSFEFYQFFVHTHEDFIIWFWWWE